MDKKVKKVHMAEVVKHGQQFIIPDGISYDVAIELLERKKKEEEEVIEILEDVNGFVWDGAIALGKAMETMFGYAHQEPTPGFFGATPPKMISVEVSHDETFMVPWGEFSLPGLEGRLSTGTKQKDGMVILVVKAMVRRKDKDRIHALIDLARKYVKEESIYRGKAFTIRWKDEDGEALKMPEPKFLDLSKVNENAIVFSKEVENSIGTNLFTPIEQAKMCRELKIPLKRGVLLSGKYGTGKTLVTYVTASKCVRNGWTFLHCQRADELADMVKFAKRYQPAVIFCEDIDRTVQGERTAEMDDILNIVDGIESKNTEVMVILTTNHLENINPAMLRPGRLDAIINVLPPDAEAVERLIRLYGGSLVPANADLSEAGRKLAGHIPAVIRECVERSKLAALKLSGNGPLTLTGEALLDAATGMRNQLDLLARSADPVKPHEKIARILGGAVVKGLDANFSTNGQH